MQYLLLIYGSETGIGLRCPRTRWMAMYGEYFAYTEGIKVQRPVTYGGNPPAQPIAMATTSAGCATASALPVTDGPFAEDQGAAWRLLPSARG